MKEFETYLYDDKNDKFIQAYAVICYTWGNSGAENLGLKVITTVLFFSKNEADKYAKEFSEKTNCRTIVVPYYEP